MTAVKWTNEQKQAIETRNCNLLVAAAAGSGKTAVLVERIINIIIDMDNPVDIDRLLVVTFTNAAASEMRERIAKALSKKLEQNPESKRLQRQLTLLNKANITTFHSFCLEVIRNNFHCIDLDPDFRISDETENILLKQETLEELFEEKYDEENNDKFLKLVEFYSNNKNDINLQNIILELYNFAMSFPWPENWLMDAAQKFNISKEYDFEDSKLLKLLLGNMKTDIVALEQSLITALNIIDEEETLEPYKESFINELFMIQDILKACEKSWDNFVDLVSEAQFKSLKRCKKGVDKAKQQKVKGIRDNVKKKLLSIKSEVEALSIDSIIEDFNELYPVMIELSKLVIEFKNKFTEKKRGRGVVDFNDFEHLCLQILCKKSENGGIESSDIAKELIKKYEEILVDEYQDTNMIQETIINLICRSSVLNNKEFYGDPNVFMVGDIKQSIYRFRQAKPELFLKKYSTYSKEEGSKYRKILLYKNFRSRENVINAVNFIFRQVMSKDVGELEYDDEEALNLGANYEKVEDENVQVGGDTELHIIETKDSTGEVDHSEEDIIEEDDPNNIQLEARMVIKRIKELMSSEGKKFKVFDKETKKYRNLQYRDIVILLRSTQKWAPIFMEELKDNNIPVYADAGSGYFNTIEVKTMMSLLQIIDNPVQDIPLLGVVCSPIASFTQEDIIDIRTSYKDINFYEAMKNILLDYEAKREVEYNIDVILINKIKRFMDKLSYWREKSIHMSIDEFIWYLYTSTGYYGYVGAMPGGTQRQANLKILFQRAKQYENTSYKGLFNFINFINRLRQSSGDLGSAKIIGENENVIRIMSIHKSKGLEFPVVIVSGLGKKFNLMDMNKKMLFHQELGYGPDYVDIEKRITYPTLVKNIIRKKIKIETLSEEMRVLYVAFTRAKEKLIMTGSVKDIKKSVDKWSLNVGVQSEKLPEWYTSNANNYLDWICASVMRHKDGDILIKKGDVTENINLLEDKSSWKIKTWCKSELLNINEYDVEENLNNIEALNEKNLCIDNVRYNKIDKRLNYVYPYEKSCNLPAVVTVTELKKKMNASLQQEYSSNMFMPFLHEKPVFLKENKGLTGAEKGTALHSVMQRLSLDKVTTFKEIKDQIDIMVMKELITEEEAQCINIRKILNFFSSSLGKRMLKVQNINREIPFHIQIKSTEIEKNLPYDKYKDEKIILQGIIDCYFEEDGKIVLIDYKTDYVENIDDIKEKYKVQIEQYAKALERITKKTVSEKYLYLFYNNSAILI
ncbi:helicase-exonuclease AddAB subunit AddA [Haloimpatiens sp. FM7330]|uniref:helicase-exonuclease AddAB subunit AddA n=1 Tax=Haloimpatiens sp. FM7330 TaxID=3298610 RepID=UPI0036332976